MKKYYMIVKDENDQVIFRSTSDSAKALLNRYNKAAYSSDGSMYANFYFAKQETNITEDIAYRVACGENL